MSGSWRSVPFPGSEGETASGRLRRRAALAMVFAGVLATGAATGAWGEGVQALAGPLEPEGANSVTAQLNAGAREGGTTAGPDAGHEASRVDDRSAGPVDRPDAEELVSRSGDRWSASYTAREYEGLRQSLDGEYVGVGISVRRAQEAGGPVVHVARVKPGSPAAEAGVRAGDRLHSVNGVEVEGRPVTEVVARLRGSPVGTGSDSRAAYGPSAASTMSTTAPGRSGPVAPDGGAAHGPSEQAADAGSKVGLEIARDGHRWKQTLHRALLTTDSVAVDEMGPGASRIKVSSFTKGSGAQLREAVAKVPEGEGVLLDLRGNSGGLVAEAGKAASAFLDGGLVATYDDKGSQRTVSAERGGDVERPLVVLVDGGTMSAAELLAGALQDRGRAVVVGSRTFGKGSVQMPSHQPDGSVAELTVGHYATPSGRQIDGAGITPDLSVDAADDAKDRGRTVLSGLEARS